MAERLSEVLSLPDLLSNLSTSTAAALFESTGSVLLPGSSKLPLGGAKIDPGSRLHVVFPGNDSADLTIDRISELSDKLGAELWWFLFAVLFAFCWFIFILFYNARMFGFILSFILRLFLFRWKRSLSVESISISIIGGKIMFRNVMFVTPDYTVKVRDGYILFLWWARVDPSAEETPIHNLYKKPWQTVKYRVLIKLLGFEYHRYNRLWRYAQVEETFGLERLVAQHRGDPLEDQKIREAAAAAARAHASSNMSIFNGWRELVPAVKFEISRGLVSFGNKLVPYSFVVKVEHFSGVYFTGKASNPADMFMHIYQATGDGVVCKFVKNPNYAGPDFQPPPKPVGPKKTKESGDDLATSYSVLRTNRVVFDYYYDEPGVVSARLIDRDPVLENSFPVNGIKVHLGGTPKGKKPQPVVVQYGPWADNQRALLWRFFYPNDYKPLEPFLGQPFGELRTYRSFDMRFMLDSKGRLELHNQMNEELSTLSISMDGAFVDDDDPNPSTTWLSTSIPMINQDSGYKVKVNLSFQRPDVTTSLKFRPFVKAEQLDVEVFISYPLIWNEHQHWKVSLSSTKLTAYVLYEHKNFLRDFFFCWGSQDPPDLLAFIPYTVQIDAQVKDFEVVILVNRYNWVDTSASARENAMLALCGSSIIFTCTLPYDQFLPDVVQFRNYFTGNDLYLRAFLPTTNSTAYVLTSLSKHLRVVGRDGQPITDPFSSSRASAPGWRGVTIGWVDIASAPVGSVSIVFTYHPVPLLRSQNVDKTGTLRGTLKQPSEVLVRLTDEDTSKPMLGPFSATDKPSEPRFDPSILSPDIIALSVNIGDGGTVVAYGTLIKLFLNFKENYFGFNQKTAPMDLSTSSDFDHQLPLSHQLAHPPGAKTIYSPPVVFGAFPHHQPQKRFDGREYRPLSVQLTITASDLIGYLPKHVGIHEPPCVQLRCEHLKFEMDKCYNETKLQVILAPLFATMKDIVPRNDATRTGRSIAEGFICLSVLQVRGHALFSGEGISLEQDTAEYGWLMDFVVGDVIAKASLPHVMSIVTSLETFIFLFAEDETQYKKPPTFVERCWHGRNSKQCPDGMPECELEDDMKYRMFRVSAESVDLAILETNPDEANVQKGVGLLQLALRPSARLVFCSSHIAGQPGIQIYVPEINVRQLVTSELLRPTSDSPAGENGAEIKQNSDKVQPWLEAASLSFGPVCVGARLPSVQGANQLVFWRIHDAKTKRLYFIYNAGSNLAKCGCFGACSYFGASADDVNFITTPLANARIVRDPHTRAGCFAFGESLLLKDQLVLESLADIIGNVRPTSQMPLQSTQSVYSDAKPGPEPPPVPVRRFPPQQRSSLARMSQEVVAQEIRSAPSVSESERYYSASEGDEDDSDKHSSQSSEATIGNSRPKAPSFPPPPAPPPRAPPPFFASSPSSTTSSSDDSDIELGGYSGAPVIMPGEQVLVNMLRQMDMDLSESPLLFHHYAAHLSQYTVHNVFGSPGGLKGVSKLIVAFLTAQKEWDFVPMIHPLKRGFACEMMRLRKSGGESVKAKQSQQQADWQKILSQLGGELTPNTAFQQQNASSKAVLEVARCLDIFITPLVVETSRWLVSSLESVVRATHPSAVLDAIHIHAHKSLLEKYEAANLTSDSTLRRALPEPALKHPQINEPAPSPGSSSRWRPKTPPKWEVSIALPQLKICSLERAVVEEHVSAFNMDPEVLKLLSCASLFAMSLENFKFEIALSPHRSNAVSASDGFTVLDTQGEHDNFARIYTCDQLSEHLAGAYLSGSLSVSQVGAQLWRLKRQSGFTSEVQVTEIPSNMSRVLYTFVDTSDDAGVPEFRRPSVSQNTQVVPSSPFGFIMAEMGMENVRLDLLKKPAFEDDEPAEDGEGEDKFILTPLVDRNLAYARQHVQFSVDNQQQQPSGDNKDVGASIAAHGAGLASSAAHTKDHIDYVHKATSSSEFHQRQPTFYDASCLLKFSNFWLSFPSPPAPVGGTGLPGLGPTKSLLPPVEKTVDYTMFDWNMLSTASAAVSAWLSAGFRLAAVAKTISNERSRRLSAIVAALLTEAYDKHDSYRFRSKYPNCLTQASQLLQEDPTCQLATVLRRYLEVTDAGKLEDDITDANLPSDITVRKGILVLIRRDWRNILHSAVLKKPEADFKKGRRFWRLQRLQEGSDGVNDAGGNVAEPEVAPNFGDIPMQQLGPTRRKPTHTRVKSIPVHMPGVGSVSVRDDTPTGAGMVSSQMPKTIMEQQQSRTNLAQQPTAAGDNRIVDWVHQACQMFGQQMLNRSQSIGQLFMGGGGILGPGGVEQDDFADEETIGLMNASGQVVGGGVDEEQIGEVADLGRFALMAVDAEPQWLFRPLMSFLDLPLDERPQAAAFLNNIGRTVAIQIRVDRFEISIVDPAEALLLNARSRPPTTTTCSDPSFVCDGFSLTTVVSGLVEAKNHQSSFRSDQQQPAESGTATASNANENAGRPASDYGAKGGASQLLEIIDQSKIANQLCLTVNCNVITQCVHMPLLRLINQCIGIAANISEARLRLRQIAAATTSSSTARNGARNGRGHRKQDSAASSTQTSGGNSTGAPPGGAVTPVGSDKSAGLSDKSKRSSRRSTIGKVFSIVTRAGNFSAAHADESFNKSGLARSDSARRTPDRHLTRPADTTDHMAEDTSSPVVERRTVYDVINERTPQVWTKLFRILEIYNRIPETKFVDKLPPIRDSAIAAEEGTAGATPASLDNPDSHASHSRGAVAIPMVELKREDSTRAVPVVSALKQNIVVRERVKLVMMGHASVKKVLILARISGLKLETVISGVEASVVHKTRVKGVSRRTVEESVATVRVSEAEIILQEGGFATAHGLSVPLQDITVVRCSVAQCQAMLDALPPTRTRAHRLDCVLLALGRIQVNIPQHALQLHTVMARETEQITRVVQELKRSTRIRSGVYDDAFDLSLNASAGGGGRQPPNTASPRFRPGGHMYSGGTPISPRPPANLPLDDPDVAPQRPPRRRPVRLTANPSSAKQAPVTTTTTAAATVVGATPASLTSKQNSAVKFLMAADGLAVEAALLPSLSAQYAIGQVSSRGIISRQSQFLINVDKHSLVFESRLAGKSFQQPSAIPNVTTVLPDRYSFDLPSINVLAHQKPLTYSGIVNDNMDSNFSNIPQQLVVTAEMGPIVNRLDSTILNQLIFIQRAFLSEISDVVMKIASGSPKNQPWNVIRASSVVDANNVNFEDEDQRQQAPPAVFKYNIKFRIQAIELTATSPTNSAVQLKTGLIQLTLSSKDDNLSGGSRHDQSHPLRLFTEASGNVEVSLGQLLNAGNYMGGNLEFNQISFFKTRIQVTSASEASSDLPTRDGLKITLSQPQILIRPTAIDKGLMLWLNYKKAYDFWVEQRKSGQFQLATRRLQSAISQIATPVQPTAVLPFIEFKVENLGIGLPLFTNPKGNLATIYGDASTLSDPVESGHALVITLDKSQISAFTSQALVSRGTFEQFCLRFADDFSPYREGSWTPQPVKVPMAGGTQFVKFVQDSCSVPEGSFSICSKTVSPLTESENAKLLVSVQWQTQGIYVRGGVGIGEKLSLLGNTLTLMSGEEVGGSSTPDNEKAGVSGEKKESQDQPDTREALTSEGIQELLPANVVAALTDFSIDPSRRSGIITAELERLSTVIGDLRHAKADSARISAEERKLRALEEIYATEFKRTFYSRVQGSGQQLLKDNLSRLAGVEPGQTGGSSTLTSKASKKYHRRSKSSGGALLPVKPTHFVLPKTALETHLEHIGGSAEISQTGSQAHSSAENSDAEDAGTISLNVDSKKAVFGLPHATLKQLDIADQASSLSSSASYRQRAVSQPPTITPVVDKEFNFHLKISSGECRLYPNKEPEEMAKSGISEGRSPRIDLTRRFVTGPDPFTGSSIDVDHATTFYIPALAVRTRYCTMGTQTVVEVPGRVAAAKRGTLHAWLDIQTFPTETVLTPWLMKFFEQVVDPISSDRTMTHTSSFYGAPDKQGQETGANAGVASGVDADSSSRGGVPSSADSASSTNNDNMEATTIGPTGSGISGSTGAASSGLGVGSVPVDVAVYVSVQPSVIKFSSFPTSRLECRLQLPSLDLLFSTQSKGGETIPGSGGASPRGSVAPNLGVEQLSGGFCITTSLSNFTFVVYHPLPGVEDNLGMPRQSRNARAIEQPDVIRGKNPVSVQLGTIRINFARYWAKKVAVSHVADSTATDELNIKLSIICDIGSAFFRLDVRRLNEIMSILKAWYSRPIMRRVIFGSGASQVPLPQQPSSSTFQPRSTNTASAPPQTAEDTSTRSSGTERPSIQSRHIILPAVRLSKLDIELRMDQIMYKTEWNNDDFRVYGGVAVDSDGSQFVKVHTRLGRSALNTSGLVAGEASVSGFNAFVMINNSRFRPPVHRLFINLHEVETKVEYRGTLILIGRVSSLGVHFFTQWFVDTVMKGRRKTGTSVSLNGEISTEHLHLIISSATTADLVRLGISVKESIDKQLTDSMQLWTSAFGDLGSRQLGQRILSEIKTPVTPQHHPGLRLHRHWQPILDRMVKAKAEWLPPRELDSIMFNAMMTLSTKNAVLACFHGPTFHASQWALFALRGASSTFNTSPQMIDVQPPGIHISQMLEFTLAQSPERRHIDWASSAGTNIAGTVMRIIEQKSAMLTRQLRSTSDWFHYAFSCSEAKDLDDFPVASISGQSQRSARADYAHETEVIFKLPAASLHLRTEQNQSLAVMPTITEWNESKLGPRPMVACSVQTDFYDHLFVSFNAESIIFLHDLIRSYLSVATSGALPSTSSDGSPKSRPAGTAPNPTEALQLDVRQFLTTQWLLNPTVRLLTFGREIDTGGIERVLVRLGFNQARSTIPKWIQRGVNDPLDALSAAILEKLVEAAFES